MASSARIEELQKKFDENPRRYFAPLANEYRKAGDIDQAIFICQEYLPQQPGHMSGHIVYGQALYEAKRLDEAKAVFETALSLDPENLIALRHLGDISRDQGDTAGARTWYKRVLEADPRNEEIAALIASLPADAPAPAATTPQPETAAPAAEPTVQAPVEILDAPIETAPVESPLADFAAMLDDVHADAEQPQAGAQPQTTEQPPVEAAAANQSADTVLDLEETDLSFGDTPAASPPPESAPAPAAAPIADEFSLEFDSGVPGTTAPEAPSEPQAMPALEGLEATHAEASSGAATDFAPLDGLDVVDTGGVEPQPESVPAPEPEAPTVPEPEMEPVASFEPPPPPPVAAPAPFVTETMAELYLQQGHRDEALAVYRQLIAEHPDDAALRERLSRIETNGAPTANGEAPASGATIHDVLAALAAYRPRAAAAPAPAESPAVPEASATAAPQAIEETPSPVEPEPIEAPSSPPAVEAARPTPSAPQPTVGGSIDALFSGAEAAHEDESAAATLAEAFADSPVTQAEAETNGGQPQPMTDEDIGGEPAHRASDELSLDIVFREPTPPKSQEPVPGGGFSFDQFFSNSASDRAAGTTPEQGTAAAAQGAPDDIEQFNAWLEGLKKS